MLSGLRAFAQTWFAKAFLAILSLGLVFISFTGRFHGYTSDAVVQAGSHEVSQGVFKRVFQMNLDAYQKQTGQTVTVQDAVAQGFDRQMAEGEAGQQASFELIDRMGLQAAPSLIVAELRKVPDFFDTISGKFSPQQYEAKLSQMNLTPREFEAQMSDELAENQLLTGMSAGLKAPRLYGALIAAYELEERTLSYAALDPRSEPQPAAPTDAQLNAFMQRFKSVLTQPEMRVLTVVRFSPKALAPGMSVDQAAVQKLYDFKKDSLSTPEKRTLVQVTAKDAAGAAAASKRLAAGEQPDAVAKSLGGQAIPYTDAVKPAVADPKVADAAFATPAGQVSAPVKSDLSGFSVVKVTAVTPASTPTLESLSPQLEDEARTQAAKAKAFAGVQAFDAAHQGGASFADSAKKAGFDAVSVGPVSAQGVNAARQPAPDLSPKLLKEAFGLPVGGETDTEDDGQGEYFAVRVEKIVPPGLPALADIRGPLTNSYMQQEVLDSLKAKADAISARIKKGESLDSVAASLHLQVTHVNGVNRAKQDQYQALGENLLSQIYSSKAGDVVEGQTASGVVMVAHIEAVTPAAPGVIASTLIGQRSRLSSELFQALAQDERDWAKRKIKPTYDLKLAHSALGVSDADQPTSGAAPAKEGKAP